MFRRRRNSSLSVDDMVRLEKWLQEECIPKVGDHIPDGQLSSKLRLKVETVDSKEFRDHVEAELCPIDDKNYNGLIRINKKYASNGFAYLHEIMHYIMDVGIGNRVDRVFTRMSKGHTVEPHEQEINYVTVGYRILLEEIKQHVQRYDASRPKMDELAFVRGLCTEYGQQEDAVIRRIKEARTLVKAGL